MLRLYNGNVMLYVGLLSWRLRGRSQENNGNSHSR